MVQASPYDPGIRGLKILVTGGSGFLGSHLCERLCEEGGDVHATSRLDRIESTTGPAWWKADMTDLPTARRVFAAVRPDIVYHLAGSVGASSDFDLIVPTYHSLLTSTLNLLVAATEIGCRRMILSGSLTEPLPGHANPNPSSPYAAAKWAASGYGRMFHSLFQAPVVILRPFMVYGPGQATSKLVPSTILSLVGGHAPRISSGKRRADWVYVSDVIDGFVAAAVKPGIEGATIDLGSGSLVSTRSIVERLIAIFGIDLKPVLGAVPDRPGENEIAADIVHAFETLGWSHKTSLENGLRQTVESYSRTAKGQHAQAG